MDFVCRAKKALGRNLSAIIAEAKRWMVNVADPSDLWELEAYLTESRKTVNRVYQYRYSDLLRVFSVLMRDGWLKEADLVGLQPDKIADIKAFESPYARCSTMQRSFLKAPETWSRQLGSIPM